MQFHYGRWIGLGLCFVVFQTIEPEARAAFVNVSDIQKKISEKKAKWVAGKTWLTDLDEATLKQMMNAEGEVSTLGNIKAPSDDSESKEVFDWRNRNGMNYVSPVRSQGVCGSCTAFATTAALEIQTNISSGIPDLNWIRSPEALFACAGGNCAGGISAKRATDYLLTTGVPDEACAPHIMGATANAGDCYSICSDSKSRSQRIKSVTRPSSVVDFDIKKVKEAVKKGPLITYMKIYADFLSYKGGIYHHVTDQAVGGHSAVIIGFDDRKKAWIIKNSWGSQWGDNGYGYIDYKDTDTAVGQMTWGLETEDQSEKVYVKYPKMGQVISGEINIKSGSTFLSTKKLTHLIYRAGSLVYQSSCEMRGEHECETVLNSSSLPEGRYDLVVETESSLGMVRSNVEFFHILNSKPNMKIALHQSASASNPPEVSFSAELSGNPVPFTAVSLNIMDSDRNVLFIRTTDVTAPRMKIGFSKNHLNQYPNLYYWAELVGVIKTNKKSVAVTSEMIQFKPDP